MLGLLKFQKKFIAYVFLGLILGLSATQFLIIAPRNREICEKYFEDEFKCQEALMYKPLENTCYCRDGEYTLTKEMIEEKNVRLKAIYDAREVNEPVLPRLEVNLSELMA